MYLSTRKGCKVVPMLAYTPRHEGVRGSGDIYPYILNFGIGWR
jgi:hypothetical protein